MAENGRVHPNCVNASNPYHECGMACLEKIAQGQGQKEKDKERKKFDNRNGIREGTAVSKNNNGERKVLPNCSKAPNPFHECDENCVKRNGQTNPLVKRESSGGSWSFGRKKKGTETQPSTPQLRSPRTPSTPQPRSPRAFDSVPVVKHHQDARTPRTEVHSKKKVEPENYESYSSSEQHSGEIYSQDHSFEKDQVQSTKLAPASENITKADRPKSPLKDNFTAPLGAAAAPAAVTKHEKEADADVHQDVVEDNTNVDEVEGGNAVSVAYMKFSFSSIDHPPQDSDEEENQSEISDSCVSVGQYHVKARISSILQSIFDKYGDIAANCKLESASMRAYYLECLCSVVQELQSISLMQMTKAKIKEMLAVIKDVESAHINVNWLRDILSEVSKSIDVVTEHQTIETAKANCDNLLESTRKELESHMRDLAHKEKEVADTKARVAETRARVNELESESSRLNRTIESMKSKVETLKCRSLANELS